MYRALSILIGVFLTTFHLCSENIQFKFEGILGSQCETIDNMNGLAQAFLPYNPVIVEIGAYTGSGTLALARTYPYGTIYAFEPHPNAYSQLAENIQSLKNASAISLAVNTFNGSARLWGSDAKASLLNPENEESVINVPCVVLDEWCKHNGINHIDFLRLDAGGLEWQILQSSPEILKTVSVCVTKTHLSPSVKSTVSFPLLKKILENQGFELLSHWYEEGKKGEAIFVRKSMYDSIFN